MARKTFVVAFFSICLMVAIPAGWADPGSNSDSSKGDAGYVEEFTGETMEEVLNRFFNRAPVPVPDGNAFTLPKGDVVLPIGDLTGLNLGSTTDADLGQDLGVASMASVAGGAAPVHAPEPGTLMLLGSGILGLAILGRRKLNK